MLRAAFNSLARLHSRPATLKRLGTPDIFSPIRITPANYFRNLRGPEYTTIKGVEFIIPKDTAIGQYSQSLTFNKVPDEGIFTITLDAGATGSLGFDSTYSDIQTAVRLLTGYGNTLVSGDFTSGFIFIFQGITPSPVLGQTTDSTLKKDDEEVTSSWSKTNTPWTKPILKGDRIVDGSSQWSIDEIVDMHDVGAIVLGWRVRCD